MVILFCSEIFPAAVVWVITPHAGVIHGQSIAEVHPFEPNVSFKFRLRADGESASGGPDSIDLYSNAILKIKSYCTHFTIVFIVKGHMLDAPS
jgi:hypothetical protein